MVMLKNVSEAKYCTFSLSWIQLSFYLNFGFSFGKLLDIFRCACFHIFLGSSIFFSLLLMFVLRMSNVDMWISILSLLIQFAMSVATGLDLIP